MNILWFAGNPALYASSNYNGGGWIGALQRELIAQQKDFLQLSVAFPWTSDFFEERDGVSYYGIKCITHTFYRYKEKEKQQLERMQEIITKVCPDVIHVFGTEAIYGLVSTITNIPVVIHLQGILSAIFHSWLPQNLSWSKYIMKAPNMFLGYMGQFRLIEREQRMLKYCRYFMGRTVWDKALINVLSPESNYYYCSEMLRPQIYFSPLVWHNHNRNRKIIVSVISNAVYKGADVILRTANLLKQYLPFPFEWKVYGVKNLKFAEKLTKIKSSEVNVCAMGVIDADELVQTLCESDLFIHPSYIENSPNSVCEAQVLGVPIITTHVGGTESIVEHEQTGIIVPANDIFMMCAQIKRVLSDVDLQVKLGSAGRNAALVRHNPQTIVNDLLKTYKSIIQ